MNLARLNNLTFNFELTNGPVANVLKVRGKFVMSNTARYVTTLKGVPPRGKPALRIAQKVFRGSYAVGVHGPDDHDLFIEEGFAKTRATVWQEKARLIN